MNTVRVPRKFIKIILEFIRWEYQMSEIRLLRNSNNEIDEPYDSPNYRHVRMLGEVKDYMERLLNPTKERRSERQEIFTWYEHRQK